MWWRPPACCMVGLKDAVWCCMMCIGWPSETDASYITSIPRHCVVGTAGVVWCALQGRHCGQCVTNILCTTAHPHTAQCVLHTLHYTVHHSLTHRDNPSGVLRNRSVNGNPVNISQALLRFPNRRNFNKVSGKANKSLIYYSTGNLVQYSIPLPPHYKYTIKKLINQ